MRQKQNSKTRKHPTDFESLNGKLPPQNIEIEEVVLGTILLDNEIIHSCIQDFNENLFYKHYNALIAGAIISLYNNNIGIDLLTVVRELKRTNAEIEISYITGLTNRVASTANFEFHFKILQEEALKRLLINVCSAAVRNSFDNDQDVFKVYSNTQVELENALKNVITYKISKIGGVHKNIIEASYNYLESGIMAGVETGLTLVDNLTNGWQNSDLIILAGRPSMGKTAAAISMAMHPALEKNIPIGIFSLEMSEEQLVSRMQSYLSEVNVGRIVKKKLSIDDIQSIERNAYKLNDAPIYIDDTANISLQAMKGKARKLVQEFGVRLLIVDYLQLMRSGIDTKNRESEIAEISRGLKGIAKELNVPVIALSQLSRAVESRGGDKKPQLSDLRESGQIEQDADMVIFCYRPEYYGIEFYEIEGREFDANGLFMFLVAKHRNGELGEIPLRFIKTQAKVTNLISFANNSENNVISSTFVQQPSSALNAARNNSFYNENEKEDLPF